MDTYQGRNFEPVTLHKYLYANVNPVMFTDPSGNITLMGVMTGMSGQMNIRATTNINTKVNSVRKTASRLCRICGKLAKKANDAGELLEQFSYKAVGKATKGTKYQVHHAFQNAAMEAVFQTTYRRALGLSIPLFGNKFGGGARKGSPHYFSNQAQKGSKNRNPTHVAYTALQAAGCRKSDATEIVQMFEMAYRLQGWL